MAIPLKHIVPCLCRILLLLSLISFRANANPCRCPDSDQVRRSNVTIGGGGAAFQLIDDKESRFGFRRTVGLNFLRSLSSSEQKSTRVLSTMDEAIILWQARPDGLGVDEVSFSVNIVYQPLPNQRPSGLAFLIIPTEVIDFPELYWANDTIMPKDHGSLNLQGTPRNATVSGSSVSVAIGALKSNSSRMGWQDDLGMAVNINIDAGSAANYTVWIDYDHVERRLSAYVDVEGMPKPASAIAEAPYNTTVVATRYAQSNSKLYNFGLLSTVAQKLSVSRWDGTVEDLPYYPNNPNRGGVLSGKVTILSSVLGSVAVTAMVATAVACYFNSRYRRWHKDLNQLASSMERLPGVPTKLEFADIKRATGNFHDTMKLGGGGYGTVYRCTLPAAASKRERAMDVAVKRFTRDVQNRRYDDFLAEVSIINRLRHKNIVPLVGWSYNKGEPLLVFEFMTNGSLDQHLFPKASGGNGNHRERPTGAAIRQWATRYGIVMDIATGLHYVHHEYEPMVLHRDIKASNVMLDSSFGARLGDFGLACTVAVDRNSVTGGIAGTWGYIAPEYAMSGKATRQTDIYALGVLILEVVTGERALIHGAADDDDVHITDRVWRIHREGRLPERIAAMLVAASSKDEEEELDAGGNAERLLLLGLACSSPNPSERPTMPEVVHIIGKSAPPPTVPRTKPTFVWPPPEGVLCGVDDTVGTSMTSVNDLSKSTTSTSKRHSLASFGQPTAVRERRVAGGHASLQLEQSVYVTATSAPV